ncbi:UNVERIFIED_CONTAM: hypothetical protein K2H54_044547 [Gekko kuhli]
MTDRSECKASVMKCFILEMEVISYESKYINNKTFTNAVRNVLKNVREHLPIKNQQFLSVLSRTNATMMRPEFYTCG